ncbi:hypothetical protein RJ639_034391 [Escallonia herrerae]|uniref:CG-1 domain-containing protein n=1 Tax=Escallonia herrerae TaxID=1293975 RepID=A0AA88WSS8_9ASTE|nr:hypothetical protein RJ639_034391 [Escallonia herrerae]
MSTQVQMNFDGEQEDANESKIEQSVNHDGRATGMEVSEVHAPVSARDLKQQPRGQQNEEHHCHKNRCPVTGNEAYKMYGQLNIVIYMVEKEQATGGSLFLFNKRVLRFFRKDGHSWRRKKDGRTVGEAHERLKLEVASIALGPFPQYV